MRLRDGSCNLLPFPFVLNKQSNHDGGGGRKEEEKGHFAAIIIGGHTSIQRLLADKWPWKSTNCKKCLV